MKNPEHHHEPDGLEVFFNKYLKDASAEPSARPWEAIEKELDLQEEKRRKRFFWFFLGGLGCVAGLVSLYLFVLAPLNILPGSTSLSQKDNLQSPNIKSETIKAVPSTIPVSGKETDTISSNTESKTGTNIKNITEESPKDKQPLPVKIQLGAFKHEVKKDAFKKIPFNIRMEKSADGLTRYYAEAGNGNNDLEIIKQAGFKDAFIKTDVMEPLASVASVKHSNAPQYTRPQAGTKETTPVLAYARKQSQSSSPSQNNILPGSKPIDKTSDIKPAAKTVQKENANDPGSTGITNLGNPSVDKKQVPVENKEPAKEQTKTAAGNSGENNPANVNVKSQADQHPDSSAIPIQVTSSVTDSTLKKPVKADSVASNKAPAPKDSLVMPLVASRWAVSLVGGPNLFFNSTVIPLYNVIINKYDMVIHEKRPVTYGAEVNAEYRLFKKFSLGIGIGYSYYLAQQDATLFEFSKYLTSDYTFYTSQGTVNVDKNTMLQGYSLAGPTDAFSAHYRYTSRLNIINIPLRASWQFLSREKFNLFTNLGVNTSYVVSQQTQLDILKEHLTNSVRDNSVKANPFNAALFLSLGCDIRIRKQLYLTIMPSYKYGLTNLSGVSGIMFKPNYFSGNAGIKIRF